MSVSRSVSLYVQRTFHFSCISTGSQALNYFRTIVYLNCSARLRGEARLSVTRKRIKREPHPRHLRIMGNTRYFVHPAVPCPVGSNRLKVESSIDRTIEGDILIGDRPKSSR